MFGVVVLIEKVKHHTEKRCQFRETTRSEYDNQMYQDKNAVPNTAYRYRVCAAGQSSETSKKL
ncbi:hypothetical protein [Sedimentisphaera salicampi]|uniref:hypothetical protein n=1 Tax=Sedimentisphaera salicampi TaxID=1941349 RepID=UPI000B9C1647|nr:hypothetical protein [Sedimentisphaera salicampi]